MSGALFPGMLKNCPSIGQFFSSRAKGSAAGGVKSANLLRGRGAGRDPPLKNSQDGSIYGHVLSARTDRESPRALLAHGTAMNARRGEVALEHVVLQHAVGVEAPAQRADGALDVRHPAVRHPLIVLVVVERYDLVFQHPVQRLDIASILLDHVNVTDAVADGESVEPVVGLGPPAVENRQIETAVQQYLLAAGAASFLRPARGIEPHVHTLDHVAGDVDVVVLDEDDARTQLGREARLHHGLKHLLPRTIGGMGLAGEHDLDRTFRIAHDALESLDIGEEPVSY